jgi:putative spermidine/putrescine transport system ATP-binding protein
MVMVDGKDVTDLPPNKRGMGMVFQGYALFPNMTAAQNIDFGLSVRRRPADERAPRVAELLELFGLAHVGKSYPHQLSGGQQQRVALARAIAVEPAVLLLDEPLSAVDAKVREELRTEIRRLQAQLGVTTILVTHDQSEALSISDIVVVMNRGRIEEIGTPAQIYAEPHSSFTAGFIGAMNEIRVRVISASGGVVERDGVRFGATGTTGMSNGDVALLLVRPELLSMLPTGAGATSGPTMRARVGVATFLGATTRLVARELPGSGTAGGNAGGTAFPAVERLAVDVPSAGAAQWPIGSEITLALPTTARVVALPVESAARAG